MCVCLEGPFNCIFFWKQDDSEVTSDEENCLTQDEIQLFVDSNKSFYNNRDQYRQHLKDKFTKYCRGGGEWFAAATTSVN